MQIEREVTVIIRVKEDGKTWHRYTAVYGGNFRPLAGTAYVPVDIDAKGHPIVEKRKFEHYHYEIRYYENSKTKYMPVGKITSEAETQRAKKQADLEAVAGTKGSRVTVVLDPKRLSILDAIGAFLAEHKIRSTPKTVSTYKEILELFQSECGRTFMDEVTRADMLKFAKTVYTPRRKYKKRGRKQPFVCSDATVAGHVILVRSLFKFHGISRDTFPPIPKVELPIPKIYQPPALTILFLGLGEEEHIKFGLALHLGLRNGEVGHAEYSDIDWSRGIYTVQSKPEYGWKVKKQHQREITIPPDFLARLKRWRDSHRNQNLIVMGPDGEPLKPKTLLKQLKIRIWKLGLACGHCRNCKLGLSDNRHCLSWTIQQFRRTNITGRNRGGMDIGTVAEQAGHIRLATTQRYISRASADEVRGPVAKIDFFSSPYDQPSPQPVSEGAVIASLRKQLEESGLSSKMVDKMIVEALSEGSGKDPTIV